MRSPFHLRLFSSLVDVTIGLSLALVMARSIGYFFAERAVVMLKIGSPDSIWKGPLPFLMGVFGPITYVIPFALWVVLLAEPIFGISPGKALFHLVVCGERGEPIPMWRGWHRFLVKTSPLWLMVMAMLLGLWQVAIVSLVAAAILLIGFFLILGSSRQSFHDRFTHTSIVREARQKK